MSHTLTATAALTNCPTITLRKGKTELQIKNADTIIKKIEEMYPSENGGYGYWPLLSSKDRNLQHDQQRKWMEAANNWFQQEMFGGNGQFEIVVSEPTEKETVETNAGLKYDEDQACKNATETTIGNVIEDLEKDERKQLLTDTSRNQTSIKTVNKNAYEIRSDVLAMALDWARWQAETSISVINRIDGKVDMNSLPKSDTVLDIAQKFYKFVENRR